MLGTVFRTIGWEPNQSALLQNYGSFARDTTQFSPRGGAASATLTGPNFSTDAGWGTLNAPAQGRVDGYAIDWRAGSVGQDCPLFQLRGTGGTGQVISVYENAANDHIVITQNNGTSGKGTTLATGSFTLVANTWYRMFVSVSIPAGGGTGNILIQVRIADATADSKERTALDCSASTSNQSNTAYAAGFGGNHGGAILGQTLWVDNIGVWEGIALEDEYYCVCLLASITGNGSDNDFNVVNTGGDTQRYQAVDEATPNGSGTTDSDYIWIDSTSANEQTFTIGWTPVTSYDRPIFLEWGLWHRNADGGKWLGGGARMRTYNGSVISDGSGTAIADPGGSYLGGTVIRRAALNGDPAQVQGLEIGVFKPANASEAGRWQISTIGCEIAFMRPVSFILPREHSRRRGGLMHGVRRGEQRRIAI